MQVTDELVSRFLTWPVPADVHPDGTPGQPGRTGTNLMTAPQARAMLEHVLRDYVPPMPEGFEAEAHTQAHDALLAAASDPRSGMLAGDALAGGA